MPAQLRPNVHSSAGAKRNRSAEHSANTTPAPEDPSLFDESRLPAFLRQSRLDITTKFEDINWRQQHRIEHGRTSADSDSPWTIDNSREARQRNRYLDIQPWEKSRVRLKVPDGTSDYINASPILLCCSKTGDERKYIATQGPKQTGVDHFWQMVWHETDDEVAVIVMLTQLAEGLREKCYQYYPEDHESEGIELSFTDPSGEDHRGSLRVVSSIYDETSKSTVRELKLTYDDRTKTVYHLFFLAWPDYGVPEDDDRTALLSLLKLSQMKNTSWANPRIIHCSAGVGRSGTFIALEHLLQELETGSIDDVDESDDPIFETVNRLREQRMTMVQSEIQFSFLYDILAEAYRTRLKDQATVQKVSNAGAATEKVTASGEPSPKAIRLSRGIKNIFTDIRERSRSGRREEKKADKGRKTEKEGEVPSPEGKTP